MNRLFLTLLTIMAFWSPPSYADVAVTEKLLLIESRTRFADATLVNTGDLPSTYEMSWRFFRMEEGTGNYVTVPAPIDSFNLSKHIAYSPRRIVIPARSSQKVRLALRLNGDAPPPGEYRAHFEFHEVREKPTQTPSPTGKPSTQVKINVGFSIPIIYRVGESAVTAKIGTVSTGLNPKNGKIVVTVPVTKSDERYSILGNLVIYYKPVGGQEKIVGQISNANIFAEVKTRIMPVVLNVPSLSTGTLRVALKDRDSSKNITYDEKIIPIGQ